MKAKIFKMYIKGQGKIKVWYTDKVIEEYLGEIWRIITREEGVYNNIKELYIELDDRGDRVRVYIYFNGEGYKRYTILLCKSDGLFPEKAIKLRDPYNKNILMFSKNGKPSVYKEPFSEEALLVVKSFYRE